MKDSCQSSVGLFVLGRNPGDELRIISIIGKTLAENGCESVHFNGWVVSCCKGSLVKAYATLEQAGLGVVTPKVKVSIEGRCSEMLAIIRALAEAAQRGGYPALMSGQEGLVEGGLRLS